MTIAGRAGAIGGGIIAAAVVVLVFQTLDNANPLDFIASHWHTSALMSHAKKCSCAMEAGAQCFGGSWDSMLANGTAVGVVPHNVSALSFARKHVCQGVPAQVVGCVRPDLPKSPVASARGDSQSTLMRRRIDEAFVHMFVAALSGCDGDLRDVTLAVNGEELEVAEDDEEEEEEEDEYDEEEEEDEAADADAYATRSEHHSMTDMLAYARTRVRQHMAGAHGAVHGAHGNTHTAMARHPHRRRKRKPQPGRHRPPHVHPHLRRAAALQHDAVADAWRELEAVVASGEAGVARAEQARRLLQGVSGAPDHATRATGSAVGAEVVLGAHGESVLRRVLYWDVPTHHLRAQGGGFGRGLWSGDRVAERGLGDRDEADEEEEDDQEEEGEEGEEENEEEEARELGTMPIEDFLDEFSRWQPGKQPIEMQISGPGWRRCMRRFVWRLTKHEVCALGADLVRWGNGFSSVHLYTHNTKPDVATSYGVPHTPGPGQFLLQAQGTTEWFVAPPGADADKLAVITATASDVVYVPKGWSAAARCATARCVTVVV